MTEKRMTNGSLSSSTGFTLLEILVAFVILSMVVTVILQLFSANLKTLWMSDDYLTATVLADIRMREMLEGAQVKEGTSSETKEGYVMDITITETLKDRTKDLSWKVFEVVMDVSWQKGTKKRSFSLKTCKTVKREVIKNEKL
ncbi:MAG: prepilin-type N-terminal cleavage/methylation domain-containing protein [Syntrophorhabdaceae bacterium]|nr:prepilin-type N-terminal cleavage/methylation domain-containing protein [Syntrophorhabdaceae bacterium]